MSEVAAGYGVGGVLLVAPETTPGVAATGGLSIPFVSESIKTSAPLTPQASINGQRTNANNISGPRSGAGEINTEMDGSAFGQLFNYFNGNMTGAHSVAVMSGYTQTCTAAAAASSGPSPLAVGPWRYAVATVIKRTNESILEVMPATPSVTAALTAGNQAATLTWALPSAAILPVGYSIAGTVVFRAPAVGGADADLVLLDYQAGPALTSYTDTGSQSLGILPGQSAKPMRLPNGSAIQVHTFVDVFSPSFNPLQSFSATVCKANDLSDIFFGCRMNTFGFEVGDGSGAMMAKFGLMAKDFATTPNPTPATADIQKFSNWQSQILIDGGYSNLYEKVSINGTNNCELLPGKSGLRCYRGVGYGKRVISGSVARQYTDHALWQRMYAVQSFGLDVRTWGAPLVTGTFSFVLLDGTTIQPYQYNARFSMTQCQLSEAGGNIGGPGRITETANFTANRDPTTGTDMTVTLTNLTPSYA